MSRTTTLSPAPRTSGQKVSLFTSVTCPTTGPAISKLDRTDTRTRLLPLSTLLEIIPAVRLRTLLRSGSGSGRALGFGFGQQETSEWRSRGEGEKEICNAIVDFGSWGIYVLELVEDGDSVFIHGGCMGEYGMEWMVVAWVCTFVVREE